MFTGIIEGLGAITHIRSSGSGKHLSVDANFALEDTKIGDSIAVNGACLTVVAVSGKRFEVDVSPETIARTTFDTLRVGDLVNLERALRLSDRLDGHLVSGHIDGFGTIAHRKSVGNVTVITFGVAEYLARYMISKGSVAVDGVSLTINTCAKDRFDVSIIPHTAKLTTVGFKKIGDRVNIETDMIGKYVERFIINKAEKAADKQTAHSAVDMQFLVKSGFV